MIDPAIAFNLGVTHRLSLSLATLVVGQTLTSESDVPFAPFTAAFDVGVNVTATSFKAALRFDGSRRPVFSPAARFFDNVAATTDDPGTLQVFAVVEHVMRRSLSGLTQVFVRGDGIVEVPFFLFGRLAGGPLVGLSSTAIET
jgi:Nuclease A inhibitor-like protein